MTFMYSETTMNKIRIIQKFDDNIISIYQAIDALNCSERTIYRYLKIYRTKWPPWFIHWLKYKVSNHKPETYALEQLYKYVSLQKFNWFGPTLLAEKLEEIYWFTVNIETLRLRMIKRWLRINKPRKTVIHRMKRERRPSYWMLLQFDWSYHDWLWTWEIKCLLASIDDATNIVDKCMFADWESLDSMITYWTDYFIKFGKPQAIYIDCHATYKVNHPTDQFDREMKTRFQRAMESLWITIIYAKCPEWKGRIENSFKTHQDRLVKELRLANIKDYESAQVFVDNYYLPKHNKKFSKLPTNKWNFHVPITENEIKNIEWFFAKREQRIVKRDWTISFYNRTIQLTSNQILKNKKITILKSIYWNLRLYSWNLLLSFN